MTRLALTLFGDFQARLGSGPTLRLRTRKTQALVAYLALPLGESHSRDKLATLLWDERSQPQARARLRETLFILRRTLTAAVPPCLDFTGDAVALTADAVDVDVAAFEGLVRAGGPEPLEEAVRLYRGDFLEGLAFRGARFEDWLMAERERLRELALDALAKLLAYQRSAGLAEPALQTALRLIALDPLQEAVHRTLMRLYAQLGRRGSALRQYQLCVGVLQRELGVQPEADTRQLYLEILRHRPLREPVHGAIGERLGHAPFPASAALAGTSTPFIGRAGEVTWLRQALTQVRAGAGRVEVIVGEAGVGKTRLVTEIASEASRLDIQCLLGRGYESDQILPFGPWADALRTSGVAMDQTLLDELAPVWRTELARLLPEVDVPGLPAPADNHLRLFDSVARLLERLAMRRPVLLILEDLHWADEMTLRLLAFIVRRIPPWRLLLVVTARDDEDAEGSGAGRALRELGPHPHAGHLKLLPLSRADTRRLIQAFVRVGSDAQALVRLEEQVWATSEGNPFVAVETTRAFQDGTIPAGARTLPLPQRVRELIAGRLERLGARTRELAAVAAVIGREFDFPLLQQTSGLEERATAEGVEELVRRHVLRGLGERFDFIHDRVHAVVYDGLLGPQRRLCHRRVGEVLEAVHAGNLEPHYLALAIHFREGEVWDKAVQFFGQAGRRATARSASREAVACFDQALEMLRHLQEGPETSCLAVDLRLDIQSGCLLLGELPRMRASLREAESLAQALGDGRRLARVWAHMVVCLWWMGEIEGAVDCGQRALAIATDLGDLGLEILARARLAMTYMYLGEYRRVIDVGRPCTEALRGDLARDRFEMAALPAVMVRGYLALSLASLGDFMAASAVSEQALEIATATNHPYSVALAHFEEGRWRALQGNSSEAITLLESSLEACRRDGFYLLTTVAAFLGRAYARVGRVADGIALLQEAVERETAIGFAAHHPANLTFLAEAYLLSGRAEEALRIAHQALDLSRAGRRQGFEADALHILGEIRARQNTPDQVGAEEAYRQARALAETLGMRPLVARCHLALGRLYRQAGKRPAAEEHLTTASTMLAQMGMRFWLEQVQMELGQLRQ